MPDTDEHTIRLYLSGVRREWCEDVKMSLDGTEIYLHMTEETPMEAEDRKVVARMPEGYVARSVVHSTYSERLLRISFVINLAKTPK